jgi:hypothetical protein
MTIKNSDLDIELIRDIGDNRTGAITAWGAPAIAAVEKMFKQHVKQTRYKPNRTQDLWYETRPGVTEGRTFYFKTGSVQHRPGLKVIDAALAVAGLQPRIRD